MIETWMPIAANSILFLMGMLFIVGGANIPTRLVGVVGIIVALMSLFVNLGVLK